MEKQTLIVQNKYLLYTYFIIFFLSGFSGLIYQSIWSRYLKLFLGNASYAQMVVLIIFMGGMAIGSALAAKYAFKLKNLILWYGICEAIIGLFGLGFHGIFTQTLSLFFDSIIPSLGGSLSVGVIKYSLASIIILPQSILLGATFPLITTGLLRKYPDESGGKISTLYFLNSFGAAIGVLCSAFVLVPKVGLPGTALTSGIINVLLGIFVYGLSKGDHFTVKPTKLITKSNTHTKLFLAISLVTGLASFMYEIAWIRMLSMVFGASTDAFEIMLSTFILGLALGALLIKGKVDKLKNPIKTLGMIQLVMGCLAALTIPLYNEVFDYLIFMKQALAPTDSGYVVYNFTTFLLSSLVMLPATICAGTTLPLITHILLKKYKSESAVGAVYAWNTVGAIIGVLLAVQIVMPSFGLKNVIITGAVLDILMGIILILMFAERKSIKFVSSAIASLLIVFVGSVGLDKYKMASGAFRTGKLINKDSAKLRFFEDGKVSTVSVMDYVNRNSKEIMRNVSNNGKPDASISFHSNKPSVDESTMNLLGILPFLYLDGKKLDIANIGFGSGMTTEAVLAHSNLANLDNIEIEEKIIEAGKLFAPKVQRVYTDPRSNIIIDDAKTVFASKGKKYDVIISEPSNPWVSGIASLFTKEWYSHVKKYMADDSLYVQWIQGYETNLNVFSSIYTALRSEFKYVHVYGISGFTDIAVIASNSPLSFKKDSYPKDKDVQKILNDLKIDTHDALYSLRFFADEKIFDLMLLNDNIPPNSDYFPIVEQLAPQALFKKQSVFSDLMNIKLSRVLADVLYNQYTFDKKLKLNYENIDFGFLLKILEDAERDYSKFIAYKNNTKLTGTNNRLINVIKTCDSNQLLSLLKGYFQFLPRENNLNMISFIKSECTLDDANKQYIAVLESYLSKDYPSSIALGKKLIESYADKYSHQELGLAKKVVLGSYILSKNQNEASNFTKKHITSKDSQDVVIRILIQKLSM